MRGMQKIAVGAMALSAWLVPAGAAQATPGPAWKLNVKVLPTNLVPGTSGDTGAAPTVEVFATNIGAADAKGPVTLTATLPVGVKPIFDEDNPAGGDTETDVPNPTCEKGTGQTVICSTSNPVHPSRNISAQIPVEVLAAPGALADVTARVESPGATTVSASANTTIASQPAPFGFLEGASGLAALFTEEEGSPALRAGSHPNQLTFDLGFPVEQRSGNSLTTGAGHPRDVVAELPPGVVVNPRAAKRCTEVEFLSGELLDPGCPAESQIGIATVVTDTAGPQPLISALYNLVPPPGAAAEVGFDAANVGVYVHVTGGVRSDSDYAIYTESKDTLARGATPIEHVQVQLWGDPSSESHAQVRDVCRSEAAKFFPCKVAPTETPEITMPSACSERLAFKARARSWEEAEEGITEVGHEASADATTVDGTPTEATQCSLLEFKPSLAVQPDTSAAESPSGVKVKLSIPQHEGKEELATSTLRDITMSFPQGMALNPAAADGLEACSPAQIGMLTVVGQTPPHFSRARPQCPDGSKIGTVEVTTPVLDHSLPGAVYVAEPYQNPFGTLLGAYVVIDSPEDGLVAKLAGRTEADLDTGQLTVSFEENPQLPISTVEVDLAGGPRAALRTPSVCGTYTTTSVQTPWSGNPPVHTSDSFAVTRGANGAPCVKDEAQMPNHPGFEAGTATPIAAAYSPLLGRLTRNDGEQQIKAFSMSLPPGLTGKLAGIATCTDEAIATASAKSGREELATPSCPANSVIGKVQAGAGAGPAPFYTTGKLYLAAPYKGAPLSGVAIVPAVAGPFDLGNVVVRAPAYVDPVTAQLTVKSDPAPHILEGVPLELRDARLLLDRNRFTLNPTSCKERAISGDAISLLGATSPLFQRFQVGGCSGLDYAPKLFIRLKGGTKRGAHPKLRAILEAKPGEEANTARASVALPRSEFLENAHIQTVCTRVQFAAKLCPAGSVYGSVKAMSPLLDEPLTGPIYLRSSSHELPDMVAVLHGPPSKPIEVELDGRIDSVNGGIRTTFDLVPDQPVRKAIFYFKGGGKGLIVNSRDICAHTYRATAKFDGQNGKTHDFNPPLNASCGKASARHKRGR